MDEEPRHILRSNPHLGWLTGLNAEGKRLLCGRHGNRSVRLRFNKQGHLKKAKELEGLPADEVVEDRAVRVYEFEIPRLNIGLYVLPKEYRQFLANTWDYDEEERVHMAVQINDWRESGRYVLHWDGEEYHCDEEGHALTHRAD